MTEFVVFNADILKWAITRAGSDSSSLKKSFKKIDLWIAGTKKPTIAQAQSLANRLGVPLGYFCLSKPPQEGALIPDFRTVGSIPPRKLSLDLRRTIEHAQYCQGFLSEYLKKNGYRPFEPGIRFQKNMDKKEAVKGLQALIGKRKTDVSAEETSRELVKKIERLGILVQRNSSVLNNTRKKLDFKEFRGFAIYDEYVPLIFVNTSDSRFATVFTLIHELTHILLSSSGISGSEPERGCDRTESFCDAVAAEYLVPSASFSEFWRKNSEQDKRTLIEGASKKFGVSRWVILRRANELKFIDSTFYQRELNGLLSFYRNRKSKGFINYNDAQLVHFGELLVNAAVISAYAGDITFREASRLTFLGQKAIVQKAKDLHLCQNTF